MVYLCIGIALFAIDIILLKYLKKSKLKYILLIISICLTIFFLTYGTIKLTSNETNECCECRDCKECDVCCKCSYPYYYK